MNLHIATIVVLAANILVSLKGFKNYSFFDRYMFRVRSIQAGEKYRMFTSGFLHIDVPHLLFNMLTLYFFANVVIYWFSPVKFILIYLISLAAGNLLSFFFHKREPQYSAVGASGAVTGILYSAILLQPRMELRLLFAIPIPAYVFGIGYLLYSIYGIKSRTDNIGHSAHFGGAIGGYLTTLYFMPELLETNTLMAILLAVPIVILFVMEKMGKI